MDTIGQHLLVELFDCERGALDSLSRVELALQRAVEASGAVPLGQIFHKFEPLGVSGVILLAESHISVHTWPEKGYAAIDFYTCSDGDPELGVSEMVDELKAGRFEKLHVERGNHPSTPSMRIRSPLTEK